MLQGGTRARKKERNWNSLEVIATWILAIFAIIAVIVAGFAYNNSQQSLDLQNTTANYKVNVIPYQAEANVGMFFYNGSTQLNAYGFLNLSMVVITPHALIVNCSDFLKQTIFHFTLDSSLHFSNGTVIPLYDLSQFSNNIIFLGAFGVNPTNLAFLPPMSLQQVAFVQPGITQVNFSIPMYINFGLNQAVFNNMLEAGGPTGTYTQLATFNINATVTDLQTNYQFIQGFTGVLETYLWTDTTPSQVP